ncbi:hypothetical protein CTAYLR_008007 [Chrysophaeum taylorii]|uniref:Protein ENHANCED DISEASE RESISTANCE 2 C-terminal domain-containing protein n=1 Tax=Chrysophaeum taylorii TaxID=2483200 RepID=A0AAD7XMN6_9STRA|nr:hypothetical protein CTAYLR_008007 [Chrysophaeum taylorii]
MEAPPVSASETEIAFWRESLHNVAGLEAVNGQVEALSSAVESKARNLSRATLSLLAFAKPQRKDEGAERAPLDLAALDYEVLNAEARQTLEAVPEKQWFRTAAHRAAWSACLLAGHGALLVWLLGATAAERLAWPLAIAAPAAWLLATSRGDESNVGTLRRCPVDDLSRFQTLGMLEAAKRRAKRARGDDFPEKLVDAGASMRFSDTPGEPMTWTVAEATSFRLRGPNYLKDKKKQPSPPPLYEPFAVDLLRAATPVFDMPRRVRLPPPRPHETGLPEWLPRVVCQTMFFPGTPPPLVGPAPEVRDAAARPKGYMVVCYWRVSPATVRILSDPKSWPPHLRLWKQYSSRADAMPVLNGCLKGVASVENLHDKTLGLPRLVRQYNAKPVLMAASAIVGERPGVVKISRDADYLEFALDVGTDFAAVSNHALFAMRDTFPKLIIDIGWLVEGRAVDELPEGLLACLRINKVDLNKATDVDDFLAGRPTR